MSFVHDVVIVNKLEGKTAEYDIDARKITILRRGDREVLVSFFHEFRHAWQQEKYPKLVDWFALQPTLYSRFYDRVPVERDAVLFANQCVENQSFWRSLDSDSSSDILDRAQALIFDTVRSNPKGSSQS